LLSGIFQLSFLFLLSIISAVFLKLFANVWRLAELRTSKPYNSTKIEFCLQKKFTNLQNSHNFTNPLYVFGVYVSRFFVWWNYKNSDFLLQKVTRKTLIFKNSAQRFDLQAQKTKFLQVKPFVQNSVYKLWENKQNFRKIFNANSVTKLN
jgi:hypothetical protein